MEINHCWLDESAYSSAEVNFCVSEGVVNGACMNLLTIPQGAKLIYESMLLILTQLRMW